MRRKDLFTEEEAQISIKMYENGSSISDIAKKLNRSVSGVTKLLKKYGVKIVRPNSPFTVEETLIMVNMRNERHSAEEIAKAIGRNSNTICRKLRELGMPIIKPDKAVDSPEQVSKCLHCPYPRCINCVDNPVETKKTKRTKPSGREL